MALPNVPRPVVEFRDPVLGRLLIGHLAVGDIAALATAPSDTSDVDKYVSRVFSLIIRIVSDAASISPESFDSGSPIDQSVFLGLPTQARDALSDRVLNEDEYLAKKADASFTRPTARLVSALSKILDEQNEFSEKIAKQFNFFKHQSEEVHDRLDALHATLVQPIVSDLEIPMDFPTAVDVTNKRLAAVGDGLVQLIDVSRVQASSVQGLSDIAGQTLEETKLHLGKAETANSLARWAVGFAVALLLVDIIGHIVGITSEQKGAGETVASIERLHAGNEALQGALDRERKAKSDLAKKLTSQDEAISRLRHDLDALREKKTLPRRPGTDHHR